MAITFKQFQSKAEGVEVHPENTGQPWTYALSGLSSATGKFSKTLEQGLPNGGLTAQEREIVVENAWQSLWYLAVACRFAGTSLDEVANLGLVELDKIGDDFLPK